MNRPLYARQPIFDANMNLVAYELLFRGAQVAGETATSKVLLAALDHDIFDVSQAAVPVFVNFPAQILFETPPFDPEKLVIEVLEDVEPTPELVQQLRRLRESGFRIALDDFELTADNDALLSVADIVKIDVLAVADLAKEINLLRGRVPHLLAEKVENHDTYRLCQELGADYFQGYFFCRPEVVSGKVMASNVGTVMRLLSALQDDAMTANKLENIILEDTTLTYRVLKLVNSAAYRRSAEVTSISSAVSMLGMRQLAAFVSLFVLGQSEHKSAELLSYTAMRGALCREMGALVPSMPGVESCFTLGVLSCCDAHFDMPMAVLVDGLPVHEEMRLALVNREGLLGAILNVAQLYQEGCWDKVENDQLNVLGLTREQLDEAYHAAQNWMQTHSGEITR